MLANDLKLELTVVSALKNAIKITEEEQDYQTPEILEVLLKDTEENHTYWLEKQLGLIEKIGLPNYLQSQMYFSFKGIKNPEQKHYNRFSIK